MLVLLLSLYVQSIPEAVALQIKRSRVRFPHWNFFYITPFFSCLIFPLFFFLHARSAISMLKHFSSSYCIMDDVIVSILQSRLLSYGQLSSKRVVLCITKTVKHSSLVFGNNICSPVDDTGASFAK